MTITSKLALAGLVALSIAGFTAPATMAQEICINAPVMSLTDTTTDQAEARQRIEALGNRCVRSVRTGERVTQRDVTQFLQSEPDRRNIDYGNLVEPY